ncbi:RNA-binding KH domain-containing protein PEPPER-like [Cucurbita pepo subsp. pepo]|uniref:RNA-binding KH domain-containing protein PEPPER-like n=1 Tax=Cucurbita pepo subsp. pepo TaxID=3664 RepID=UPI000C9D8A42|nr:RNA-binding KH domain-containing protein PEPPER-like [Cucurbita pepo subsp. pepo]
MATNATTENGSTDADALNSSPQLACEAAAEPDSTEAGGAESDIDPSNQDYLSAPASDYVPHESPNHAGASDKKWPGWPGDCVFRIIVPVVKVGSIIGRRGDLIKKICEETRARIRVLDGAVGTPDRVVLISGKEEPEAPLSPAMDAVLRIFKRVSGFSENEDEAKASFCSVRLLVASTQAINLIGKQGSLIKSIQESTGASVRVLSGDEMPFYAGPDERMVELQGETLKVLKALEAVVGHLRKFLVDHSVLPLFEKSFNTPASQDRQTDAWADKSSLLSASQSVISNEYPPSSKRESLFFDRETHLDSHISSSGISLYGPDRVLPAIRSSGVGRSGVPIVTQVTQTMQIPLSYAEDIIGVGGANIAFIRRNSGAILTIQESRGLPDEITVEIKGTSSQVQMAQQLIQEAISGPKEPVTSSSYGRLDTTGLRSSYSQLGASGSSYTPSSLSSQSYGGYGSSGLGGYSTFRL